MQSTGLTKDGLSVQRGSGIAQTWAIGQTAVSGGGDGSSNTGHGGGDSNRSSDFSDGGGKGSLVYDGIESVNGVSGVLDGTHCAVRLHQAVAALDDISAAALLLSLDVPSQSVVDVVREAVLGVGVVVGVDGYGGGYLSDCGGGIGKGSRGGIGDGCVRYSGGCVGHWGGHCTSDGGSRGVDGGGADNTGPGDGYDGGEKEQL
jgi:hypothetical protein